MSKKHLKRLKELQRLQALHQDTAQPVPPSAVEIPTEQPSVENFPVTFPQPASVSVMPDSHMVIKKDLVFLIILIVAMLLLLVALNWLIDHTALSQWIIKVAGFVTS